MPGALGLPWGCVGARRVGASAGLRPTGGRPPALPATPGGDDSEVPPGGRWGRGSPPLRRGATASPLPPPPPPPDRRGLASLRPPPRAQPGPRRFPGAGRAALLPAAGPASPSALPASPGVSLRGGGPRLLLLHSETPPAPSRSPVCPPRRREAAGGPGLSRRPGTDVVKRARGSPSPALGAWSLAVPSACHMYGGPLKAWMKSVLEWV